MRTDKKRPICESQVAKAIELTNRYKKALRSVVEPREDDAYEFTLWNGAFVHCIGALLAERTLADERRKAKRVQA